MKKQMWSVCSALALFISLSCGNGDRPTPATAKTFSKDNIINAVIEVPAGNSIKMEYSYESKTIEAEKDEDGHPKKIKYLPYPANYGYVADTKVERENGGEDESLDVLILSERLETGVVIGIQPIAALVLRDNGVIDTKIIAIPVDDHLKIIEVNGFRDFMVKHSSIQNILKQWFQNYKGVGTVEFIAWKDERYALKEIKKWSKS